jgi:DNA helicase IV
VKLPTFEDLSMEQDGIYNLALDGNYVVSGPPGTGKSVMALYRAQALTFDDRRPTILMFSNLLKQFTDEAARGLGLKGRVETFYRWMDAFWLMHYKESAPRLESDRWVFDWQEIAVAFGRNPPAKGSLADLIVDEGQDLPKMFYALARWYSRNITVFADENQQLKDEQCTVTEIRRAIGSVDEHKLTRNYRNTREIALLAKYFYVGGPTGIPDLPQRRGDRPTLTNHPQLNDVVEQICRYAKAHSDHTIGVACKYSKDQRKLLARLSSLDLPLPVETYIGKDMAQKRMSFDDAGVKIVNYQSLKGLEFDALFVPQLELVEPDVTSASVRMLFYVVMSRARRELHLSWCGNGSIPPLVADVPDDVLERL